MSIIGKVYLVGAGCGDFDLITIRGMKLLQRCDTVVYDSLIDVRLLDFVPEKTEKICVGKRAGYHSESQEHINEILVKKAKCGKTVVRLKGGDPFVFGRGGEELSALQENDIPYGIIPGITSAVAAAELAGIPVTHRYISRSFHVITGHTADTVLPEKLNLYADLDGTLVFLMGLKNLRQIAEGLMSGGMNGKTPAAVISNGATSKQYVIRGDLSSIADLAECENIKAPAVIIVGETAGMDFSPTIFEPLSKITVTVTGTLKFAEKLTEKLRSCGADVTLLKTLEIKEYKENTAFDTSLRSIENYSWIALTSMNGAEIFLDRMRKLKIDIRRLGNIKFAAIGSGTAGVLEKNGIFPDLIPDRFTSADLGNSLAKAVHKGERILILRAENGSAELANILSEKNADFDEIKIYEAAPVMKKSQNAEISTDYLTFSSVSGVRAFFESGYQVSRKTKIVCIGSITADALLQYGISEFYIAAVQNADGIVDEIIQEV